MIHQAAATQNVSAPQNAPKPEKFLLDNWKRVLATAPESGLKFIKVYGGVASITNSNVILRARLNLPDGFYRVDRAGSFIRTDPRPDYAWERPYPDIEVFRPPFETLKPMSEAPREEIKKMIIFTRQAIDESAQSIHFHSRGLYFRSNGGDRHFPYVFEITMPILVNPNQLSFALMEVLRYDMSLFYREEVPNKNTPLIIGHRWNSCAMVKVQRLPQG